MAINCYTNSFLSANVNYRDIFHFSQLNRFSSVFYNFVSGLLTGRGAGVTKPCRNQLVTGNDFMSDKGCIVRKPFSRFKGLIGVLFAIFCDKDKC